MQSSRVDNRIKASYDDVGSARLAMDFVWGLEEVVRASLPAISVKVVYIPSVR